MNILLVTPEFAPKIGGIGRSAQRLAREFAEAGHPTTVLTFDRTGDLTQPPYTRKADLHPPNGSLLRVGPIAPKHSGLTPEIKATLKRQFIVEALHVLSNSPTPEIVLSLGLIDAGFVGLCIATGLRVPHVVSARGADVGTELFQIEKLRTAEWVIGRSAATTFVNKYLHDLAAIVFGPSSRHMVISNAVYDPGAAATTDRQLLRAATRETLGIPHDAKVIGWVGTFRPKKGMPYLDTAFRRLAESDDNVHLLIVGGPRTVEERGQCPILDEAGPLRERVHCVGMLYETEELYAHYAVMDVFAYPSIDDGLSNAVLEAMVFGLPVVLTDIFADVAAHGRTALIIPRFDSFALADAIKSVLDDPQLANTLATHARHSALQEFAPVRERDSYLALFHHLLFGSLAVPIRTSQVQAPV